jgi:hypothetical protein
MWPAKWRVTGRTPDGQPAWLEWHDGCTRGSSATAMIEVDLFLATGQQVGVTPVGPFHAGRRARRAERVRHRDVRLEQRPVNGRRARAAPDDLPPGAIS